MAEIGNIKPPKPVWPQPAVEKVKQKEDQSQQQRQQRYDNPAYKDKDDDDSGIDEYV
jgi:predicted Zn-dependent peptidase